MKNEEKIEELELIVKKLKNVLKIKFMLFFIYISCFCGIYVNTQIHLIKDSLISFTLVYPFAIYLLPGIFRIYALKAKNKDKECMYKFSQLIQSL